MNFYATYYLGEYIIFHKATKINDCVRIKTIFNFDITFKAKEFNNLQIIICPKCV